MRYIRFLLFLFIVFIFTNLNVFAKDNYLKDILINDKSLENFKNDIYTYDIELDSEEVKVVFLYEDLYTTGNGYLQSTTGKRVLDKVNTYSLNYGDNKITSTLKKDTETLVTYTLNIKRSDPRSSENSLYSLNVGGKSVTLSEKLEYDVEVSSELEKIEVTATRKDDKTSKFISGYGERIGNNAVTLSGEKTTVEIKVQAENESIKTYTINILRKNLKSSDNALKSLTITNLEFDFKPNIYEYNLSVKNNIEQIKVNPVLNDLKAKLEYEEVINLNEGINNIIIKVIAENQTTREYKLNITRREKEGFIKELTIDGIDLNFDPLTYYYDIKTDLLNLSINATLISESATLNILDNENLVNGSVVKLEVLYDNDIQTYELKINKEIEEVKEDIKEEKQEEKTIIFGIPRKYEMLVGLATFGFGLLMMIIAILTKTKGSQIM